MQPKKTQQKNTFLLRWTQELKLLETLVAKNKISFPKKKKKYFLF